MLALAYCPTPSAAANRSTNGCGRIGRKHAAMPRTPGGVVARTADAMAPRQEPTGHGTSLQPSSLALAAAARGHRTLELQRLLAAALRRLVAFTESSVATWSQAQRDRRSRRAMQQLDERVLRDLGLARSELLSLDAELRGAAEPTRVLTLQARRAVHSC